MLSVEVQAIIEDKPEMFAAIEGFSPDMRLCLKKDELITFPEILRHHPTLVSFAAFIRSQRVLEYFLGTGFDGSIADDRGRTVGHFACASGDDVLCRALWVQFGVAFDARDLDGRTPGYYAATMSRLTVLDWLLTNRFLTESLEQWQGTEPDVMRWAAGHGHADVVGFLLDQQAGLCRDDEFPHEGITAMHLAAKGGHKSALLELLKGNGCLFRRDGSDRTPLMYAIECGSLECVRELWAAAAPRDGVEHPFISMLDRAPEVMFRAVRLGYADVLQYLLEKGVALPADERTTALHLAAKAGHVSVVRDLLDHGGDASRCDASGRTPLMYAIKRGSLGCVKALWEKGAILAESDALLLVRRAARSGHPDVLHYLEAQVGLHGTWTDAWGNRYVLNSLPSGGVRVPAEAREVVLPLAATNFDSMTYRDLAQLGHVTVHTDMRHFDPGVMGECHLRGVTIVDSLNPTMAGTVTCYRFVAWCAEHGVKDFDGEPTALSDLRAVQLIMKGECDPFCPAELMIGGDRVVPIITFKEQEMVKLLYNGPAAAEELAVIAALEVDRSDEGEEPQGPERHRSDGGELPVVMNAARQAIADGNAAGLASCQGPLRSRCLADGAVQGGAEDVVRVLVRRSPWLTMRVCEAIVRQGKLTHLLGDFLKGKLPPAVIMSAVLGGNADGLAAVLKLAGRLGEEITPPLGFEVAVCLADNADALAAIRAVVDEEMIVKFDAWRCAGRAGLKPETLLDFAVLRRAVYIIAGWYISGEIDPDVILAAAIRLGSEAVASLAIDLGASVTPEMVDACADADMKQVLKAAIPVAESPRMTEEEESAPLRLAETDRRNNVGKPWTAEGRQIASVGCRDIVEPAAIEGTLCSSDEFTFQGNSFLLVLTQSGEVLQHWFHKRVTKRTLQEALLGLLLRLLCAMGKATVIRDNHIRHGSKLVKFFAKHGIVIAALSGNSNDMNGTIEALIHRFIALLAKQVDKSNVPGLMASFVKNYRFPHLWKDFWMTASAVSFAAGGTTMQMLGNGVFRGDLHATKAALRQLTKEDVRKLKVYLELDLSEREAAEHLGLFQQTAQNVVARDECGLGSDGVNLDLARVIAIGPAGRGHAVCFADGRGHADNVRACDVGRHRGAVQRCVAHLEQKGFPGTILGKCGNRAVIAFGPFKVEVPIVFLSAEQQLKCAVLPADSARHFVSLAAPGRLRCGRPQKLDQWTESVVTADGHSLVYELVDGFATFTRVGPAAMLRFDGPGGVMIANYCGAQPGSGPFKAIGDTRLLSLPAGGIFLETVLNGQCPADPVELQSFAAQVGRSWLHETPSLRHLTWTLIGNWATNRECNSYHELAAESGLHHDTVKRYIQRALAVGLPLVRGLPVGNEPPWMDARRACVERLLRAGSFPGWPELMERLDPLQGQFPRKPERLRFMLVAQAVLSLRHRGLGESHVPVRAELVAEGVKNPELDVRNEELEEIIADVRSRLQDF